MAALNAKQARFVQAYLVSLNATQAAIEAGYSARTATEQGSRLLRHVQVQAAIAKGQEKVAAKHELTVDRVVDELLTLALYDPGEIANYEIKGPKDIASLPVNLRRAIVGWAWDKAGNFTLKFAPKPATLQLLGQHLGMFKNPVDEAVADGLAALLTNARRRASEAETRH